MSDPDPAPAAAAAQRRRSDAEHNRDRIIGAATRLLRDDPDAGVDAIAAAAGLGRATVYRHFGTRRELVAVAQRQARDEADANERDALRPAGELAGSGPAPLDVADVLNKVPPHLIGEQIVAEAQRLADGSSAALYLVDIDGSRLLRFAGSAEFPEEIPAPLAVGPELPRGGLAGLRRLLDDLLPGSVPAPLFLRGRAVGLLLAVRAAEEPLLALARQAAAALELASRYTDLLDMARRRKATTAAAEIQQNLLPPRVARISGAALAANVLPGYSGGGDWFDHVDNPDGAWIGIADAEGVGAAAAALGAIALGAFRAARRNGSSLEDTVRSMHDTVGEVGGADDAVAALIARWHGPSSTVRWVNRGAPSPLLVDETGHVEVLEHAVGAPLGPAGDDEVSARTLRLRPGQRLVMHSDGVLVRRREDGAELGRAGVIDAIRTASASAASTVRAIEEAVTSASSRPLEDDATLVVLTPQ